MSSEIPSLTDEAKSIQNNDLEEINFRKHRQIRVTKDYSSSIWPHGVLAHTGKLSTDTRSVPYLHLGHTQPREADILNELLSYSSPQFATQICTAPVVYSIDFCKEPHLVTLLNSNPRSTLYMFVCMLSPINFYLFRMAKE